MRRTLFVIVLVAACGAPARPAAEPPSESGGEATVAAEEDESTCCCTFQGAVAEDFPDVATWVAAESLCRSGTGARMPGQCIEPRWCEGQAPDPPPPVIEATQCCCDVFDGNGESFHVLEADACAARGDGACVDAGFCA